MKFLLGVITSTIFIALMFIGCWLYFDFPISTNDEQYQDNVQTENINTQDTQSTQETQQTQERPEPTKQKHNGYDTPNMNNDSNSYYWQTYATINEGTQDTPYVTVNGQKVDPKFVINDDGSLKEDYLQRNEVN